MSKGLTKVLACKVDEDLARAVRHAAQLDGASTSEYLRRLAIAAMLRRHAE